MHFVALNSVLTDENWTHNRWATPAERMQAIGRIDGPDGSPFMVGARQRAWLAEDLTKVSNHTPVMVFSHSPLQKIYRPWNFWTEDAEQVHALLARFDRVHVIYGHVHQLQYNQIGNISFHSAMATAWPYPYPQSYAQAESYLPKLTVPMNRADPFFERDGTGWQFMNVTTGRPEMYYNLYNNAARTRAVDPKSLPLEDGAHQAPDSRIPPQQHY